MIIARQVEFVADQKQRQVRRGECLGIIEKGLQICEGIIVGDVVDENCAGRAAIVGPRYRSEPFRAGRVPELFESHASCQIFWCPFAPRSPLCLLTCNFILFLLEPVPTLMILLANSTPMVCDERTRHSFLTKRCNMQDL